MIKFSRPVPDTALGTGRSRSRSLTTAALLFTALLATIRRFAELTCERRSRIGPYGAKSSGGFEAKLVRRSQHATTIFNASETASGTLAEVYLASRGLYRPLPDRIRFHPNLKHRSGETWPAMVALISHAIANTPMSIHRTFLARDGFGKAPTNPQKMMLGPTRGGVVRLAEPSDVLMIGEGIETCLAAMQEAGHPAWAALSAPGLKALELPIEIRNVIILADGDDAGERASLYAAHRWTSEGRRIRIARPPKGMDFNDLLISSSSRGARHAGS